MGELPPYAYNLDHEPIGPEEASALLADFAARHVRATSIDEGTWVSTVFLVFDHGMFGGGPPVLYESMVFADDDWSGDEMRRWHTREEAEQGHDQFVAEVRAWVAAR